VARNTGSASNPIINATGSGGGVTQVKAGSSISITGTASQPIVNYTGGGVAQVLAGTSISITGTASQPIINYTGSGVSSVTTNTASGLANTGNATNVVISNTYPIINYILKTSATSPTATSNVVNQGGKVLYTISQMSPSLYTKLVSGTGFITVTISMVASTVTTNTQTFFQWGLTTDSTGVIPPTTLIPVYPLPAVQGLVSFGTLVIPCSELSTVSPARLLYIYVTNPNISSINISGQANNHVARWTSYNLFLI